MFTLLKCPTVNGQFHLSARASDVEDTGKTLFKNKKNKDVLFGASLCQLLSSNSISQLLLQENKQAGEACCPYLFLCFYHYVNAPAQVPSSHAPLTPCRSSGSSVCPALCSAASETGFSVPSVWPGFRTL